MRDQKHPLNECPDEVRQAAIEWMLVKTEGNRSETARRLGLHRNTVSRRAALADAQPEGMVDRIAS
jgi:ActR/RegA family two-component response regulator